MKPLKSLAARCENSFDPGTRLSGEDYFRQKKISIDSVSPTYATLTAVDAEPVHVEIDWKSAKNAGQIQMSCTCPDYANGIFCAHGWAALLELDADGLGYTIPSSSDSETFSVEFSFKHTFGSRHSNYSKPIVMSAGAATDSIPLRPGRLNRIATYIINTDQSQNTGLLTVEFFEENKPRRISLLELAYFSDPLDREILSLLLDTLGYESFGKATLPIDKQVDLLTRMSQTGRLMLGTTPIQFDDSISWEIRLELKERTDRYTLEGTLCRETQHGLENKIISEIRLALPSGLLLVDDKISVLKNTQSMKWITLLRGQSNNTIPKSEGPKFIEAFFSDNDPPTIQLPKSLAWEKVDVDPTPHLVVTHSASQSSGNSYWLHCDLQLNYRGHKVSASRPGVVVADRTKKQLIRRQLLLEKNALAQFLNLEGIESERQLHGKSIPIRFRSAHFSNIISQIISWGWTATAYGKSVRKDTHLEIKVSSGVDWFDLDGAATFGDLSVPLPRLLEALQSGEKMIELGDGSLGMLPETWLKKFGPLALLGTNLGPRLSRVQGFILSAWLDNDTSTQVDSVFQSVRTAYQSFSDLKPKKPGNSFQGTLRPYQEDGLGWLEVLAKNRLGGILADDMGLGKTIQVLAHLDAETKRLKKSERRPSIVILPKSLLFNWAEEAQKFTPDLSVLQYAGSDRQRLIASFPRYDLILMTYSTFRQDIELLSKIEFHYAVIDEAQAIKNPKSLAHQACCMIRAHHRLAMTGTPVENSIDDLYAILDFVTPGLLNSHSKEKFRSADPETLAQLTRALKPFILRRTKSQVLKELPEKMEMVIHCELNANERKAYDQLRDYYRASLKTEIERVGIGRSKIIVLEALLRLRQAACHFGLIDQTQADSMSSKTEILLEQIKSVTAEGHKVLVFSQFTSLLSIVRNQLAELGLPYEYLDGATSAKDRKKAVTDFNQSDSVKIFLISLKAGGVGLNLASANYVYILDPWWNPAAETQAIDRAHRIGQKNKVMAYRLITQGTVEEKIVELQKSKRALADAIVTADVGLLKGLTAGDIELLLS